METDFPSAGEPKPYRFRLYVSDDTPNSQMALERFLVVARQCLNDDWELETIDVFEEPARAEQDGILLIPTLVRVSPLPQQSLTGSLSNPAELQKLLCPGASPDRPAVPSPGSSPR